MHLTELQYESPFPKRLPRFPDHLRPSFSPLQCFEKIPFAVRNSLWPEAQSPMKLSKIPNKNVFWNTEFLTNSAFLLPKGKCMFWAALSHRGQVKDYYKNEQEFPSSCIYPLTAENIPIISRAGLILLHRNQSDFLHNGHIISKSSLQPLLQSITFQGLGICISFYSTNIYSSAYTTLSMGFSKELGVKFLIGGCRFLFWITRLKGQPVWGALVLSPMWQSSFTSYLSPIFGSVNRSGSSLCPSTAYLY